MNGKIGFGILAAGCIVLAIALVVRHSRAREDQQASTAQIMQLSNDVVSSSAKLTEQQKVNLVLETNLALRGVELDSLSNRLASVSATLERTEADARSAAQTAKEELAKRDAKISELEGQNDDLTRRMGDLNTAITGLEGKITETERQLAASEGDRDFLQKELKRLQAEKAQLERQFNDLAVLRDQVRKLRDELSVARRLEWIRRGLYGDNKGAEKLQRNMAAQAGRTNFDLNVEVRQDGGATVVTNPPPATPTAPK
jgi:chromosome segregation ATPase